MKRLLATVVVAGIIGASVMVSHAATLHVTAATLQVAEFDEGEFPSPTPQKVQLQVALHRYSGQGAQANPSPHPDTIITYLLPAYTDYRVSFTGTHKSCDGFPEPKDVGLSDGFGPDDSPTVHPLCVQQGHSGLTVTLEPSGEPVQPASGT